MRSNEIRQVDGNKEKLEVGLNIRGRIEINNQQTCKVISRRIE